MLAKRLPSIFPPLTLDEELKTTRIHSIIGLLKAGQTLVTRRPFRARPTTPPATPACSAATSTRRPAKSPWRITACCSSTKCPSSGVSPALWERGRAAGTDCPTSRRFMATMRGSRTVEAAHEPLQSAQPSRPCGAGGGMVDYPKPNRHVTPNCGEQTSEAGATPFPPRNFPAISPPLASSMSVRCAGEIPPAPQST